MQTIAYDEWKRKRHYELFKDYENPRFSLTANVDVTWLLAFAKREQRSFFSLFLFHVVRSLNAIPEFKTRIRDGEIVIHDVIHPSYTVLDKDELFGFVTTTFIDDRERFCTAVAMDLDKAKAGASLTDIPGKDDLVYVSALPWLSFSGITHPRAARHPDTIPLITWGKYFPMGDKMMIPLAVDHHHGLADGIHVGRLFALIAESSRSYR